MAYKVTFTQQHTYEVEAQSDSEAYAKAYERFVAEQRSSVAQTWYDDVEVECDEEDEE